MQFLIFYNYARTVQKHIKSVVNVHLQNVFHVGSVGC